MNELTFPSVGAYYDLQHYIAPQLAGTIVYRNPGTTDEQWHIDGMNNAPDTIMHLNHPIRDPFKHNKYRAELSVQYNITHQCPD